MAYTPNTWATGDTITATKLNNIEQGIVDLVNSSPHYVDTTYNDSKGGYEINEPLADLAEICEDGQTLITTGDLYHVELYVYASPFGNEYEVGVTAQIHIEPGYTPPLLVYEVYEWDSEQSVLTENFINYTLTPAT